MLEDEFPDNVIAFDAHVSDVLQTNGTNARANWYGVSGIPHTMTDGQSPRIGASDVCVTEYNVFRNKYITRMNATGGTAVVDVTGSYLVVPTPEETLEIQATATFEQVEPATLTNLRASIVVLQDGVELGQVYNHVVRYIYDEMVTLTGVGDQVTIEMTVAVEESPYPQYNWNVDDLELVAYVQTLAASKEIYQAGHMVWQDATDVGDEIAMGPVRLLSARPNPFRPQTRVGYSVSVDGAQADLGVFDLSGRRVATLFKGAAVQGYHEAVWNGQDDLGRLMGSGVYFIRLITGSGAQVQKVIRLD